MEARDQSGVEWSARGFYTAEHMEIHFLLKLVQHIAFGFWTYRTIKKIDMCCFKH